MSAVIKTADSAAQGQPFEIEPIGPTIGAEIQGVDFSRPVPASVAKSIQAALMDHLVVYFRNADMTPEQQVAFALRLQVGEIEPGAEILSFAAKHQSARVKRVRSRLAMSASKPASADAISAYVVQDARIGPSPSPITVTPSSACIGACRRCSSARLVQTWPLSSPPTSR